MLMYVPKNLQNAPTQELTQLRHCLRPHITVTNVYCTKKINIYMRANDNNFFPAFTFRFFQAGRDKQT